jgi:hypothetical protein
MSKRDIVERLRKWRCGDDAVILIDEAAAEIERLRNGAPVNCETVQYGGVVPTVTWFDEKIAEECRIAQAEIERLRLTDEEREAVKFYSEAGVYWSTGGGVKHARTLLGLLHRTK